MKAVLLAAGEGQRLLPLTATKPKHMLRVGGKTILEHCLYALKANGITEILIITHYMGETIRNYIGNGSEFGVKIDYAEQTSVLGTGNAASIAEPFVEDEFVLAYGDLLFSAVAMKSLIDSYLSNKVNTVMAAVPVEKPENYGIIELGEQTQLRSLVEKPTPELAPSDLANAGLYIFKKDVFDAIRQVKKSPRGEWELTDAVSLLAKKGKIVKVIQIEKADWFDVGTPWDLLEANSWVLKRMEHKVLGKIEDGAHILGPVTVASKEARVRSGAYIEGPCFIDDGADVGPNCFIRPFTSIGKNVRVGNACEIKNSIIMDTTHVGHLSYVGDSILSNHCNLGAGTVAANLRLDDGPVKMVVKDKVVNTGRRKLGSILGDNVRTGVGALLMPGIKVGNDSWVGAGTIVEHDLPANSFLVTRQAQSELSRKRQNA